MRTCFLPKEMSSLCQGGLVSEASFSSNEGNPLDCAILRGIEEGLNSSSRCRNFDFRLVQKESGLIPMDQRRSNK